MTTPFSASFRDCFISAVPTIKLSSRLAFNNLFTFSIILSLIISSRLHTYDNIHCNVIRSSAFASVCLLPMIGLSLLIAAVLASLVTFSLVFDISLLNSLLVLAIALLTVLWTWFLIIAFTFADHVPDWCFDLITLRSQRQYDCVLLQRTLPIHSCFLCGTGSLWSWVYVWRCMWCFCVRACSLHTIWFRWRQRHCWVHWVS